MLLTVVILNFSSALCRYNEYDGICLCRQLTIHMRNTSIVQVRDNRCHNHLLNLKKTYPEKIPFLKFLAISHLTKSVFNFQIKLAEYLKKYG